MPQAGLYQSVYQLDWPPTGMTSDRPDCRYHSKAGVLMSQPLKSSCARRPSSRYTAGELAPPLWNWILMSRPMAADGTCRYSTGRPGRENAPASAVWPTTPIRPGSRAAAAAPSASRRGNVLAAPRNLSTSLILASSFFVGPNIVGRTASPYCSASLRAASWPASLLSAPALVSGSPQVIRSPHRCRTAQLCFRSQPHLAVWTAHRRGPETGPRAAAGPAQLGCGSPRCECADERLFAGKNTYSGLLGAGRGRRRGAQRTPTEWLTKILLPITVCCG